MPVQDHQLLDSVLLETREEVPEDLGLSTRVEVQAEWNVPLSGLDPERDGSWPAKIATWAPRCNSSPAGYLGPEVAP